MNTRRLPIILVLACILLALASTSVSAQGNELQLFLGRIIGFSLGDQIQGQFTLSVSGPADLVSVTYEIDGREMGTVTQAPFKFSFSTDSYDLGRHQFSATARTASGRTLKSNSIAAEIVTPAAGWQAGGRIALPLFGIVLLVMLATFAVQFWSGGSRRRYEPGAARKYGLEGGTICPKCKRPFALPLLSPNLLTGKLVRCPFCGKWSVLRRVPLDALRAAEKAELEGAAPQVHELSPEQELARQIEESRLSR